MKLKLTMAALLAAAAMASPSQACDGWDEVQCGDRAHRICSHVHPVPSDAGYIDCYVEEWISCMELCQ